MKTITMLEFRRDAEKVIAQVRKGRSFMLTYRGKPVMRLEPVQERAAVENDPFYGLSDHADRAAGSLSNDDIDRTLYGA